MIEYQVDYREAQWIDTDYLNKMASEGWEIFTILSEQERTIELEYQDMFETTSYRIIWQRRREGV